MNARRSVLNGLGLCLLCGPAADAVARGVSPYLPLDLEPEVEQQIEQVLILADKPVLTRPIAAATVLDALPQACEIDRDLCRAVRAYLQRYMRSAGIVRLGLEAAAHGGAGRVIANRHGLRTDSAWFVTGQAFYQPSDYVLVSLGGVAYDGETTPTGSVLSLGTSHAQLDVGYRGHWFSPMTDSVMLLGTEAPAMPAITLSNAEPLTWFGFRYEAFVAEMSRSRRIVFADGFTAGRPKLAGLHLAIEPASGWSLAFNRLLQFGGGERGGQSFGDVLEALFRPSSVDNVGPGLSSDEQFGNQAASVTSRFLFPGRTPFAVYFEYAGEDTSRGRDYLLGNAALSIGIDFPRLWRRFDLTYEVSEWQNGWYVHNVYLDGLSNEGRVLGHWAGDQRQRDDAVGGQSHLLRLGWLPQWGGRLELHYRTLANEAYSPVDYERAHDLSLRYSRGWERFTFGAELYAGRDVFGEDFGRFGVFVRYPGYSEDLGGSVQPLRAMRIAGAELFVAAGLNAHKLRIDLDDNIARTTTDLGFGAHAALGVRRAVAEHHDLGARLEVDDVDGHLLLGVRAVDYRYRFDAPFALSAFLGAARYDLATPAYGFYLGVGAEWRNVLPGWDLALDVSHASKVARDHVLPADPPGPRPDSFYDINSAALSLIRRF